MDGRPILPAVVAVADAREKLSGRLDRHHQRLGGHVLVIWQRIVSATAAAAMVNELRARADFNYARKHPDED